MQHRGEGRLERLEIEWTAIARWRPVLRSHDPQTETNARMMQIPPVSLG
jgi:hypothetical protein